MFLKKHKKLHRNGSIRLTNYDYSRNGYYFVTICAKYRSNVFGEIIDGEMKYNEIGKMANKFWQEIPEHFSFVILDEWVIMPDHVHGIIVINKQIVNADVVGAQNIARLQNVQPLNHRNIFGPQSNNLASIIRGYKIAVTKHANVNNIPFKWQPLYYEHIIRDDRALNNIRRYIRNNPRMWHN